MIENAEAEAASVEQLEVGKPLLDYLQQQFGWKYREIIALEASEISADAQSIFGANNRDIDRLIMLSTEGLIIEDQFGSNHSGRREFFSHVLKAKGSWIKQRSLLSGNNLLSSIYIIEDCMRTAKRKKLIIDFDLNRVSEMGDELSKYREMSFNEKAAYAQKMNQLIRDFLVALSQAVLQIQE